MSLANASALAPAVRYGLGVAESVSARPVLLDADHRPGWLLADLNVDRELIAQFVDVRHDQDQIEVMPDGVDRLDQPFPSKIVLRAEAFIDHERLQARACAASQELAERDAQGEIDPEAFAATVRVVIARAKLVADHDVERIDHAVANLLG